MYAIEFWTKIKNGVIHIPPEYKNRLKETVKVIILAEEEKVKSDMIDHLLNSPLKMHSFKPFTREEIYEPR